MSALASSVVIPVSEYLQTTYRPDRDYIDGELKERNVGEQPHAHVQIIVGSIFRQMRLEWGVRPLTEQRVQVGPTRYRIPDICVLRNTDPKDAIVAFPPMLCIEILSADQALRDVRERVEDYIAMGVKNNWVIDPWKRLGYYGTAQGFTPTDDGQLKIQGTPIEISLASVFSELDES
jgi:Uma2 family endonuclease